MTRISVKVDGTTYEDEVEPRLLLVHHLRDRLGLTGTPVGCDTSNCGACTVDLDGVDGPAEGLPRTARAAVRLLHARHADGGP